MPATSDDTLQLLEDVALPILRKAYYRLGHLQWSEAMIRKVLKKHILNTKEGDGKVWVSYMEESDERLKKLSAVSRQVREIVHQKELHGGE
jgi:hypothetical protein